MILVKAERQGNQRRIIKAKRNGSLMFSGSRKESSVAGVWRRGETGMVGAGLGMWTWSRKAVHQRLRLLCKGRWLLRNGEGNQFRKKTLVFRSCAGRERGISKTSSICTMAVLGWTETGKGEVRLDLVKR